MDNNLIKKPEFEIVTIRIEWYKNFTEKWFLENQIIGFEGTYEDFIKMKLKEENTIALIQKLDKQIDFENSKVFLKIKNEDDNQLEINYEYKLSEMIDNQILTNVIFKKNKYIEYLQKNLELQEIQIEEMKQEKIIFDGYQTPVLKEMKLKS